MTQPLSYGTPHHPNQLGPNRAARRLAALAALVLAVFLPPWAHAQTPSGTAAEAPAGAGGPIRLRQPAQEAPAQVLAPPAPSTTSTTATTSTPSSGPNPPSLSTRPGEFETFVGLPRFGIDMVSDLASGAVDFSPLVPPEYLIQSGDEVLVTLWGSIDADLRLLVDRTGRVSIPRVGPVQLAGVRFVDLQLTLAKRVAQVFKNFELSASLGRLRGVRVYVTGFVQRPGAFSVAGLSTVMSAVMRAGGPAAGGSFRQIELRRESQLVATFDLYDLLLRGDRAGDRLVQPDDVIHVLPVGPQVALRGSTNKQAVYELKVGETLGDLLRMAGGFSPVADRSRVALERLDARNAQRVVQLPMPENEVLRLSNGDVVRVFSAVEAVLSIERQNRRVRVEGEVAAPGEYLLPPGSTLADAVRAAGGLTASAYIFGAQFSRESVRQAQAENYERALRDMETDLARTSASKRLTTAEDAVSQTAQQAATTRLVERLRALQPNGRVVLQIPPDGKLLPDLLVEDQDKLVVPAKPTSIGVFGSVFNTGNYLFQRGRTLEDYLRLAGGPTKGADEGSIFVVRANGQVVSSRQNTGYFGRGNQIATLVTEPGDTVFVPEEMEKSTLLQTAKDWTLLLFQLGIGSAGIKSALN